MKLGLSILLVGELLGFTHAVQVHKELVTGGCNDSFHAVGDAFTGLFWKGPDGQSFCRVEGEFRFMINGVCSSQAITCERREPEGVPVSFARKAPSPRLRNMDNVQNKPQTLAQRVRHKRRQLGNAAAAESVSIRNLVLMIKFKDHDINDLPPIEDYEKLFNSMDGPDGHAVLTQSIKEFYTKQSSGRLNLTNVLSGWIEVSYTEAEAAKECLATDDKCCNGGCDDSMLVEAIMEGIEKYEAQVGAAEFLKFNTDGDRYSLVDMFTVIHSGYGAESTGGQGVLMNSIWSHKYVLTYKDCTATQCPIFRAPLSKLGFFDYNVNPGRWFIGTKNYIAPEKNITHFGVIAHEMGHFLGLPDFYDTDYSSQGLGDYCLMANSWGLDYSQNYPPSLSAVAKYILGWVDVEEIDTQSGNKNISLPDVHMSPSIAKISFNNDDEFWLIENRQAKENDQLLQGGILAFHVDMKVTENTEELDPTAPATWAKKHPMARLIQPDNRFDLELSQDPSDAGDWFPYILRPSFGDNLLPSPNINSYALLGTASGLSISAVSDSSDQMSFILSTNVKPSPAPTSNPATTKSPASNPTTTKSPTPIENNTTASPTFVKSIPSGSSKVAVGFFMTWILIFVQR